MLQEEGHRHRLLQQREPRRSDTFPVSTFVRVARNKQGGQVWLPLDQVHHKVRSPAIRQHNIAEYDIEIFVGILEGLGRFGKCPARLDLIPLLHKRATCHFFQIRFVLYEQYPFSVSTERTEWNSSIFRIRGLGQHIDGGEVDGEAAAHPNFALHGNPTLVGLKNPIDNG